MKVISQMKDNSQVRQLLAQGCVVGAFFDDIGIGSHTQEQHLLLLEEFLRVCQRLHLRVKLTKCEFAKEIMDYLGFQIGHGWWRPSQDKVDSLSKFKVSNLKQLRSFIGALNFYRRHIHNFTASSARLTDLTKKNAKWVWGPDEERCFQELKNKIANVRCLGVPRSSGEILVITDSSDIGGGGSLFQWQKLTREENEAIESVLGVNRDCMLRHNFEETFHLVPLGYFNWKWSPTRRNYATYEILLWDSPFGKSEANSCPSACCLAQ